MPLVLDASVALAWCFEIEMSEYADAVLARLEADTAIVPAVWPFEVANALTVAERRKRLRPAEVLHAADLLQSLPIEIEPAVASRVLGAILELARSHSLSSYDASYLEVAMRQGAQLASLDAQLRETASLLGIEIA